jgi:hypothetical protein
MLHLNLGEKHCEKTVITVSVFVGMFDRKSFICWSCECRKGRIYSLSKVLRENHRYEQNTMFYKQSILQRRLPFEVKIPLANMKP